MNLLKTMMKEQVRTKHEIITEFADGASSANINNAYGKFDGKSEQILMKIAPKIRKLLNAVVEVAKINLQENSCDISHNTKGKAILQYLVFFKKLAV